MNMAVTAIDVSTTAQPDRSKGSRLFRGVKSAEGLLCSESADSTQLMCMT